ncbi:MAG: 6-phosphofructokinase [candidate division Zixibacteria bacterium]|nr:6-phosphofructokinase [candidate division Zixibacteria bacterium]
MRIGILTGGGDCPGLNAVIRVIVRRGGVKYGWDILGIREGWRGLMGEPKIQPLELKDVGGILRIGGTILKTSRTNPFKEEDGPTDVIENIKKLQIDALVAIGGEDTLGVAEKLVHKGVKLIGVPKTIDNDLSGTDLTFGFDTAVNIAMEAIDRVHTTAESHNRILVVEVMGRHTGWIALYAGVSGGADAILIPERPVDIDKICKVITKRHQRGKTFSVVVVAEGAKISFDKTEDTDGSLVVQEMGVDQFGHVRLGGIGILLADELEKRTGFESRAVILGHIQRGGSPTAFDRMLATRYGSKAVDLIHEGQFGRMVALRGNEVISVPLAEAVYQTKKVDNELINMAEDLFG